MSDASLLIDQRSASLEASDRDIKAWAGGRRVFVSSLITDMPQERAAVRAAIESVGAMPVMFEDLGAQDISAEQAYLSGVRSSEVYVGILGPRYGVRMPDGYSATHAEYLEAERNGLRLCLFVRSDNSSEIDGPQRDLINSVRNLYTTSPWTDPGDLQARVQRRLSAMAAEELAPWVRIGRAFFRAREVVSDGSTISLVADVRSDAVHMELVHLRDSRASGIPFASSNAARTVRISELSSRMVSTIGHEERLSLMVEHRQGGSTRVSLNGMSSDELSRRALSDGLFGTSTLGQEAGWFARPMDPLEPLRGLALDDSVLRPVARLLFGEYLMTTDIASRAEAFALGPSRQGSRRLRASWIPPRTYENEPDPSPVSISGDTTGL